MKKCIMSAIAGAAAMWVILIVVANAREIREQKAEMYEHINFVSIINQEDCFMCGSGSDFQTSAFWGEDNVAVVNLNSFEVLRLEINRYGDNGVLIEEAAGYMQTSSLMDKENGSCVYAYTFPDNGYANVSLTGVQYAIDRDSVQNHLCQTCLDSINSLWFTDKPPAEYAIISFEDRTVRPLLNATKWFSAGNFGVDCEFKSEGKIDLLIHNCPSRYEESSSQSDEPIIEKMTHLY